MEKVIDGEKLNVPRHVAVIMDGNGRWAKKKFMPRGFGHKEGAKTLEQICEDAHELGIEYLTVYAFSTENWKRSVEEISGIMSLLRNYLDECVERASKNNMRVRFIGDRSALDEDIRNGMDDAEKKTAMYDGFNFTIAINYGGRDELRRAVADISKDVAEGKLDADGITEDYISKRLDTAQLPDPDLLIRTSGEYRLSNYLIWQLAYAELYFTDVLWPDFCMDDLKAAVKYYDGRNRRYGGV